MIFKKKGCSGGVNQSLVVINIVVPLKSEGVEGEFGRKAEGKARKCY